MKIFKLVFLIFFLIIGQTLANEEIEKKIAQITKNLRCLVCQGQSVYDSNSDFAEDIKLYVREELTKGASEKKIYSYMVSKYGDWILFNPPLSYKSISLWLIPFLFILFGAIIIYRKVKIEK
jgi:cytochrome c-type biogenesis protein CcmH